MQETEQERQPQHTAPGPVPEAVTPVPGSQDTPAGAATPVPGAITPVPGSQEPVPGSQDTPEGAKAPESQQQPFTDIPLGEAGALYKEYINSPQPEYEAELFGNLVDSLQREADQHGPARDLWFNYQLVRAYLRTRQWERAQEAIDDALLLTENIGKGEGVFLELQNQILEISKEDK